MYVDLRVDLNTEDDTDVPWAFVRDARDPALLKEGAWLVVGSGSARAVAQVVQIDGDLVWVRPLPGPVSQYRELVGDAAPVDTGAAGVNSVTPQVEQLSVVVRHCPL